jgi:hypothetical protein
MPGTNVAAGLPDMKTNDLWRDFLTSLHASIGNGVVQHYGDPRAELQAASHSNVLVDLSHLALVRAEGADTENFLQGQFTNDIKLVTSGRAQLSAYCNPKGRMFAIFLIAKMQDAYLLQLPAALAENTIKRLRMYILRAKVKMDFAPELLATGLSGPDTESLLRAVTGVAPATAYEIAVANDVLVIRLPGTHPRFEIIAMVEKQISLWQALLAKDVKPAGAGIWSWLDIGAGIPSVLPGTVEEFVPQMANLDAISGVSFTKGCYPGQEIVARMHYLGRLKQRMFKLYVETDTPPAPGTPVYALNFPDQAAGSVVSAAISPRGGCDLLAVIQLSGMEGGEIRLGGADGIRLQIEPQPYELPAATR